jgi:hypothetical protein
MGSRNTFVTSYIYSPAAVKVVGSVLQAVVGDRCNFHGSDAGYFSGVMKTSGNLPFEEHQQLLDTIDSLLAEIGYTIHFDIVVIGDDERGILHRDRRG